ncbi:MULTISPECIES: hypothetical protein [Pseudomonas]|jgi:hypothetical protein|nr:MULTISPECIES: hypothetical protein [Pseudomonas]WLG57702.1 hypothetical protein PSH77_04090 [Pseudomonas extremorientalis]
MSSTVKRMLVASKSGDIAVAILVSETRSVWVLEIEKREVRVSKSDKRQRAFRDMSEALQWAGAEPELIAQFVHSEPLKQEPAPE